MRLSILITLVMLITMIHGFKLNRIPPALDVNGVPENGIQQINNLREAVGSKIRVKRQSVSESSSSESASSSRRKRDLGMVSSAEFNRKKRYLSSSASHSASSFI